MRGIDAHEDDGVGAVVLLARAAIGAEQEHVVGVARSGRLGEDGAQLVVDHALVLETIVDGADPAGDRERDTDQKRDEDGDDAGDDAPADAFAGNALAISPHVLPAVLGAVKLSAHHAASKC